MNEADRQVRTSAILFAALGASVIGAMIATGVISRLGTTGWIFAIVLVVFALAMSVAYATRRHEGDVEAVSRAAKPKRDEDGADMLSLLTDEDIEELRERFKRRMIDRIDAGEYDHLESFEELLAGEPNRKRAKR